MHPFLFEGRIFGMAAAIPTYPFLGLAGIGLAAFIYFIHIENIKTKYFEHIVFFAVVLICGLIGSRVTQLIIDFLIKIPLGYTFQQIFRETGSTVTGGIVWATAAVFIYGHFDPHRIVTWHVVDTIAVCFPFGHMFGRIGCFFAGCCYGRISESGFFTVTYPENWVADSIPGLNLTHGPRIAAPLIAALGLFCIGTVLLVLLHTSKRRGHISALYFMLYGVFRFFHEYLRDDPNRGFFRGLSTGQWFGAASFFFGLVLIFLYFRRRSRGLADPPFLLFNKKEPWGG